MAALAKRVGWARLALAAGACTVIVATGLILGGCVGDSPSNSAADAATADGPTAEGGGDSGCTPCVLGSSQLGSCCLH